MPLARVPIGALSAIYVGDGPPAVAVLTRLNANRTGGSSMDYTCPESWESNPDLNNSFQSGEAELRFTLRFVGGQPAITKLAMGNSLSTPNEDDAPGFVKYTVLLLSANPDSTDNILLPECYTEKRFSYNWNKDRISEVPIVFIARNRNRFKKLYRKGTSTDLATILGVRSPI